MALTSLLEQGKLAAAGIVDFATGLVHPTVRIGVTGLSRSGKTVFITALVNALLNGAQLPLFEAQARGRIRKIYLEPQPDDDLPRFAFETNLASIVGEERTWPQSTRRISQLRLTLEYEPEGLFARSSHGGKMHVDIIDYPGEWLLDLPLMSMSYAAWSRQTIEKSKTEPRSTHAAPWFELLRSYPARGSQDETAAQNLASTFTQYLSRCRQEDTFMSALPPGRFLMPGDLEGSPLLTFSPLALDENEEIASGSLGQLMEHRYNAYVSKVVKPFFFSHFARLDRQIVLVDAMSALNAGASAVSDLGSALSDVLACFRLGASSVMSELFGRKIDRIVFAATKADLLHHTSHDKLENILQQLVASAQVKAESSGATHHMVALSSVRSTREASVQAAKEALPCIVGVPQSGQTLGTKTFDGTEEAAIFPGDLPSDATAALVGSLAGKLRFIKFRPPVVDNKALPYIRLDRVIEFALGDKFA
jgi:uncharacterized protein